MNERSKRTAIGAGAAVLVAAIVALIIAISSGGERPSVAAAAPPEEPETPPAAPEAAPTARPRPELEAPPNLEPHEENVYVAPNGEIFRHEMKRDPNGPERDWRDFNDEEKAAQSSLEHDTADFGAAIATLEQGKAVEQVRGSEVTDEEQAQLRDAVSHMAEQYEDAHDSAYRSETSIIDFAESMAKAREEFDAKVRDIYGLSDDQFYELFPHRREIGLPK